MRTRPRLAAQVQHFLHAFYEMAAYLLNTIIFLIAGIRLGTSLVHYRLDVTSAVLIYPIVGARARPPHARLLHFQPTPFTAYTSFRCI